MRTMYCSTRRSAARMPFQPTEARWVSGSSPETAVTSRKALDKTCTLTPKLFFQAAAQLGAMNADPIGDSYIAIIHPYGRHTGAGRW